MDGKIGDRRAEIYTYESENIVYGLSWSVSHYSLHPTKRVLNGFICSPLYTEAAFGITRNASQRSYGNQLAADVSNAPGGFFTTMHHPLRRPWQSVYRSQ